MSGSTITIRRASSVPFTMIPNAMLRDNSLSMEARGLLAMLLTHREDFVIYPEKLQEDAGVGRDKMKSMLRELREAGYLELVVRRGEGGHILGTTYVISDHRETENPSLGRETPLPADGSTGGRQIRTIRRTIDKKDQAEEDQASADLFPAEKKRGPKPKDDDLVVILKTVISEENARDFVAHRAQIKKPMTTVAARRMAIRLAAMRDPNAAVDLAIRKGWQDVYEHDAPPAAAPPPANGHRPRRFALPGTA